MTQTSSQPRVKQDGITASTMTELYALYPTAADDDFKMMCLNVIEMSAGKRATKDKFSAVISECSKKSVMLQKVTNYFLAGEGKGV